MPSDEEVIDAFRALTPDGGSSIQAEDLKRLLTTMGEKFTDDEADALLADAGGGSKIDYAKFVKAFSAKAVDDGKDAE